MKKTIGIPKALLYYKYGNLWTMFFEELDLDILISPNTNNNILENGTNLSLDEACMALKVYLGHINYLIGKCDYILVPRIKCLKKHEKLCTNFSCLYDLVNNLFDTKILNYNIDVENGEDEVYAFISMGKELGFSYLKSYQSYLKAKEKDNMLKLRKINKQKTVLATSNNIKILIAGHPYVLYDDMLGKRIIKILEDNNIDIIYSDNYDNKYLDKYSKKISKSNYFTYNKEIMAAISYYESMVDGIILITAFPCGPDSLCNEMIKRYVSIPKIEITIDGSNATGGIETRLESFIDILKERKTKNERKNN